MACKGEGVREDKGVRKRVWEWEGGYGGERRGEKR